MVYGKVCGLQMQNSLRHLCPAHMCESRMFLLMGFLCHAALHCGFLGQNFLFLVEWASILSHFGICGVFSRLLTSYNSQNS